MDLSIKTVKRKNGEVSDSCHSEEDLPHSSSKLRAVDTCAGLRRAKIDRAQWVTISGLQRRMTSYNPLHVNRNLTKLIGNYETLRPLPSGDLLLGCCNAKQVNQLLQCDNLGDTTNAVPVKIERYSPTDYRSMRVISGVPLDMQDSEILENLQNYGATFAKRLRRKTNAGPENSLSVLIGFSTDSAPSEVKIGYLRFHTKEYNPPPMRCYNCNYYGHMAKHCRGKQSCAKCGGRDHLYKDCANQNKCINCH